MFDVHSDIKKNIYGMWSFQFNLLSIGIPQNLVEFTCFIILSLIFTSFFLVIVQFVNIIYFLHLEISY